MSTPITDQSPRKRRVVAAIDLGSTSFSLVIARTDGGGAGFRVLDEVKERVGLAAGMTDSNRLGVESQDRALACLTRFGERLRGLGPDDVRAMGTSTLRIAENAAEFLSRAQVALGHKIEVITGGDEAKLVFRGVAHGGWDAGDRLVIDIGGGSTELVVGRGLVPNRHVSVPVGHVTTTELAFPRGVLDGKSFDRAVGKLEKQLGDACQRMREHGWASAVGTSGTMRTAERVLERMGFSERGITRAGLERLRDRIVAAEHVDDLRLDGLSKRRRPTFAGGVVVLTALLELLGLELLTASPLGLREGMLHDLLGHSNQGDLRDRTVERLMARYGIARGQAGRVRATANKLFAQCRESWELYGEWPEQMLRWAADVHEIGHAIRFRDYHVHGAAILEESSLAGFTVHDQLALSLLVLCHRDALQRKEIDRRLVDPERRRMTLRLAVLLRIGALIHRARGSWPEPETRIEAEDDLVRLFVPEGLHAERPLLWTDLGREAERLAKGKIDLKVIPTSDLALVTPEALA